MLFAGIVGGAVREIIGKSNKKWRVSHIRKLVVRSAYLLIHTGSRRNSGLLSSHSSGRFIAKFGN